MCSSRAMVQLKDKDQNQKEDFIAQKDIVIATAILRLQLPCGEIISHSRQDV